MNNQPGIAQQNSGPFTFQGNSVSSNVILPPPVLSVTAAQSQNIPLSFPQSNPFNFSSPQTPPQQTNAALQMPNPTPQFNFNAFQQQYQNSQQQQPNSFIPQTNAFMQQQLSNQFPPPPQSNILL